MSELCVAEANLDRIQPQTHTMLLRHPNILATAKAWLASTGRNEGDLKLLSFGCSIGDELASLRLAFPKARVLGCDLDALALATAKQTVGELAEVFLASEAALRARAPFDLICALSSLCVHPPPNQPFVKVFPFERFAAVAGM